MKLKTAKEKVGAILLGAIALAILAGSYFRILDSYELETLDFRFKLRPPIPVSDKIVIVEIGDDTIKKLGRFPFDRSYHTLLIKALSDSGARMILFDLFFSEAQSSDREFTDAIAKAGNVYLPVVFDLDLRRLGKVPAASGYAAQCLEGFRSGARGIGHINVIPDIDGKFRRSPVYIKYDTDMYKGTVAKCNFRHSEGGHRPTEESKSEILPRFARQDDRLSSLHPSAPSLQNDMEFGISQQSYKPYLSLLAGCDYMGISQKDVKFVPARYLDLGRGIIIPLDDNSNIIVNFSAGWGKSYRHLSYVDIIQSYLTKVTGGKPSIDLSVLKDKVCIIGLTAVGTVDLHPNPFDSLYPAVGMHAEVLNSIINNRFIGRASPEANLLILLLLSLVVAFIVLKTKPVKGLAYLLSLVAILILSGMTVFNMRGIWIDLIYPIIVMMILHVSITLYKYILEWKKRLVMENELQIAKKIQESFLPKSMPLITGLGMSATMSTARQVGGDLYDFVTFSDGRLGVMIGDVSGKGVPASLFMAMCVGAFRTFALSEAKPEQVLADINIKLSKESSSNLFVTMFYSIFDMKNNIFIYGNGGHLPVLYFSKEGRSEFLDVEDGAPLGLMEGAYSGREIKFASGDTFIFYTDGVTEAMNSRSDMYGRDRLLSAALKSIRLSPDKMIDDIMKDVRRFEPKSSQHDDITIIIVKVA